jgi:hypothetical protein
VGAAGQLDALDHAPPPGFGVGISTEVEYVDELRTRMLPILDADVYTEAFAVCLRTRRNSPAVRAFMSTAEKLFDTGQNGDQR